jgi:hypothetical protein
MAGTESIQKAVIGNTNVLQSWAETIAGHPSDDLAPGTLNSILKQAKLQEVK